MRMEKHVRSTSLSTTLAFALTCACVFAVLSATAWGANPYLPLWECIPDGEPHVFEDPANPGKMRVYIYGSHDVSRTMYCGRELVIWSAPTESPNVWRFDGVIFRSEKNANGDWLDRRHLADVLYAPDVCVTTAPDGKKTYWLYPNNQGWKRNGMIAKSDRPDGPFTVCNWSMENPYETTGVLRFDPAVFVDDDGRVYGYWGFERSMAAELDPVTMCTVKPGASIVEDMVGGRNQPGDFRFFEASSMRKIKDKYVFIYSRWTKDGEFGLPGANSTLAYAYSDNPLGPWTYGGTIIDIRGREKIGDRTVATVCPGGNTHGSLCEVNGKWFVFYHRQTGDDEYSRQAMVSPVTVEVETGKGGKVKISEVEYTSEGFETDGLDPLEVHPAGIASYLMHPDCVDNIWSQKRPKVYCRAGDNYGWENLYDEKINIAKVANIFDGAVVGFKYFNFAKTQGVKGLKLKVGYMPQGSEAHVEIWVRRPCAAEGGTKIGEFDVSADEGCSGRREAFVDVSRLAEVNVKEALFFVVSSQDKTRRVLEFIDFRFETQGQSFSVENKQGR